MEIVLHGDVFVYRGRDVIDAGNAGHEAVDVVEGEADLDAGFFSAGLFAGAAGKDADDVGAPLREDGLDGAAEAGSVSQQEDHGGNTPGHADHGDGGAAAVVDHRLPGLAENVFQHGNLVSFQLSALSFQHLIPHPG